MTEALLRLHGIDKWFGDVKAVDSLTLEIKAGETFTLLGPSGCGKTTTLRMIAGLETPDAGEIFLGGKQIVSIERGFILPPEKRHMGMVFQSYAIWPHMTVAENIAYPLKVRHRARAEIKQRVEAVLELVGMVGFADRPAPLLSGGQQQRVALARALVYEPEVLLLDEPLSNLDVKLREQMRVELKLLQQKLGLTLIYVTHDQAEALSLSDHIALMNFGKIEQMGPPHELYQRPRTAFARDFLGKSITIKGKVTAIGAADVEVELPAAGGAKLHCNGDGSGQLATGQSVSLSVRPEAVRIDANGTGDRGNRMEGIIEALFYLGDRSECEIRVGEEKFTIYVDAGRALQTGQKIGLHIPPESLTVWPE